MKCPQCGAATADNKRFCGDCGSPLASLCAVCGSENPPGKHFCGDCGGPLGTTQPTEPTATAERRHLTVMFADLVGSTELSSRLDPEDLRKVILSYQNRVAGLVARFSGFVARYSGDGVLVYFGYPQAHEDDAEQAVRASLAIVDAIGTLETLAGPPGTLSTRVGIATGLVVVGDVIGSGSSMEWAVVGDTPNVAARLQGVAAPNAVVIAEATRRLIGGLFEYEDLGPLTLRGLGEPVQAWKVVAEKAVDSRFEALRPSNVPLVDRSEEFDLLVRRWEQARRGEGRVVLLSGEPGIGKSRLIAALEQRVGRGARIRRYLCWPNYQDSALHPVIRQLERAAEFERGDRPETKFEKLRTYLAAGPWSPADIALLADLMSIPVADPHLIEGLSPHRKKEMTFEIMVRQFHNLTRKRPALAILEDIHWADPTSLDLLEVIVEAVERLPMLLIVTARPDVVPPWATRPHVTVQFLNALPRSHAVSLIENIANTMALPEPVMERIVAHADGVPLFLEELTKTVVAADWTRRAAGAISLAGPLSADLVPATLQATLMARLDRTGAGKELAQIGSVIGREFSFELVHALSGHSRKSVEDALNALVQAELATARGQPPNAVYTFKHALVQDAAYSSLLRDRRRAIHLAVAETLESDTAADAEPQLIAWHFAHGGKPDRAVDWYLTAAERATGRFALAEIVSHLREGLRQIEHLPASPDTRRRELSLQTALGRALVDHHGAGSESVRAAFERARLLCLELGETKHLLRVHDGLANYHVTHSELQDVLRYADEMRDIGQQTGDRHAILMAHRSAGFSYLLSGEFDRAHRELQKLIDLYEPDLDGPHAGVTTRDQKVSAATALAVCRTVMGYPASGAQISHEAVMHAEGLNHVISLIFGLRRACVPHMIRRDTQAVMNLSSRLLALASEYDTFKGSLDGNIFYAWSQLSVRRETALLDQMLAAIEQLDLANNWVMLPFFMACAAEIKLRHEGGAGAVPLLDRAMELTKLTGQEWCEAEIIRLKAYTAPARERSALLEASLAKGRSQGAKLWELRTATNLAEFWEDHGRGDDARELLESVYASFTEGFDAPDLVEARRMLDKLRRPVSQAERAG